jgi:undecaprenyl diphosphate synthase
MKVPNSVAIIMDGNRRWAERRGLAPHIGHRQGAISAENIIRYAREIGVRYLTLFAFSSENWNRSRTEIDELTNISDSYLKHNIDELNEQEIKVVAIGDLSRLPIVTKKRLDEAIKKTAKNNKFVLTLAISYGAWEEAVFACREIAKKTREKTLKVEDISARTLADHLFTKDIPNPDLLIRTSGELRLSNFLLLQMSYSELYFSKTLWPDFQPSDFNSAIQSFNERRRRFGADQRE